MSAAFFDTNILIYAYSKDAKAEAARALLEGGGISGLQNLNEFANVARKKLKMAWPEVDQALAQIGQLCAIVEPIDRPLHRHGRMLAERYGFSFFDALVVAAALGADCETLYSEDMHDGLVVEEALIIRNPFR